MCSAGWHAHEPSWAIGRLPNKLVEGNAQGHPEYTQHSSCVIDQVFTALSLPKEQTLKVVLGSGHKIPPFVSETSFSGMVH